MLKNFPETVQWIEKVQILRKKWAKFQTKAKSPFYAGDLVSRMGEREISAETGRLLDNPGECPCEFLLFKRTPLEGVRGVFLAIINVFLDELSQLPLSLIPAVYM